MSLFSGKTLILNYSRHPIQWSEAIHPNTICSISSQKRTRPPEKERNAPIRLWTGFFEDVKVQNTLIRQRC